MKRPRLPRRPDTAGLRERKNSLHSHAERDSLWSARSELRHIQRAARRSIDGHDVEQTVSVGAHGESASMLNAGASLNHWAVRLRVVLGSDKEIAVECSNGVVAPSCSRKCA